MMKNLTKYLSEKLIINKDYNFNNLGFDDVKELYILTFYYGPDTFRIERYDLENIKKIDKNSWATHKITAYTSNRMGFSNVLCKYIEEYNILYSINPRTRIIIRPDDKELLNNLLSLTYKLKRGSKYTPNNILKNYLHIKNYYEFYKKEDPFIRLECDMENFEIANIQGDIENALNNIK